MPKFSKLAAGRKHDNAPRPRELSDKPLTITEEERMLPQVWLPVDLTTLEDDNGGRLQFSPATDLTTADHSVPVLPVTRNDKTSKSRSAPGSKVDALEEMDAGEIYGASVVPLVSVEEVLPEDEHNMATFWATEEANEPRGWQDQEELDYTRSAQLVTQASSLPTNAQTHAQSSGQIQGQVRQSDSQSSGIMFSYAQSVVYRVQFLGELHSVSTDWLLSGKPVDIINVVETGQRQGRIPWTPYDDSERVIVISKYGVKVMDGQRKRVHSRHALHSIVSVLHYTDPRKQPMLAFRITKGEQNVFDLFVYQCETEAQATELCASLTQAFEAVLTKMRWEEGMGAIELH